MKLNFTSSSGLGHFSAPAREPTTHHHDGLPGLGARSSPVTPRREAFCHFAAPSRSAAYAAFAAFGTVVLACLLAAAMLASVDVPLVLGGL